MEDMTQWFEDEKNTDKIKESYRVMKEKSQFYKNIADMEASRIESLLNESQATGDAISTIIQNDHYIALFGRLNPSDRGEILRLRKLGATEKELIEAMEEELK